MFHFILCCNENVINWIPLWNSICFRIFSFNPHIPTSTSSISDSIRFRIFDLLDVLIFRLRIKKVYGKRGRWWCKGAKLLRFRRIQFYSREFSYFHSNSVLCTKIVLCQRAYTLTFSCLHRLLGISFDLVNIYTIQRNQFIRKNYFSYRINIIFFCPTIKIAYRQHNVKFPINTFNTCK